MANKAFLHVNAVTAGAVISPNSGAILGSVVINTAGAATGSSAVAASSGVVAAAVATATLPAVVGQTNAVSGFQITGLGATGATVVVATLTGVLGGTQSYEITVPAGATTPITPVIVSFNPPLPATGTNVAIAISVPSFGTGNTNAEVNIQGTLTNPSAASVLTIYDGQSTSGRVIAVCNVQNTAIPALEYNLVAPSGLFYSYVQTGTVTAVGDFTITYQ